MCVNNENITTFHKIRRPTHGAVESVVYVSKRLARVSNLLFSRGNKPVRPYIRARFLAREVFNVEHPIV